MYEDDEYPRCEVPGCTLPEHSPPPPDNRIDPPRPRRRPRFTLPGPYAMRLTVINLMLLTAWAGLLAADSFLFHLAGWTR